MAEVVKRGSKKHLASGQYRRFAADTFGLRINNNLAQINFSIDTQDEHDDDCLVQEATAILTLPSLKVLQIVLTNALQAVEAQFGPIPLSPGKEEELRKKAVAIFAKKPEPASAE